jgi:hypothetical protein
MAHCARKELTMDDILSQALEGFVGLLRQLLTNLLGPNGPEWRIELSKFLRKEVCWARLNLVRFIGVGWRFARVQTLAKITTKDVRRIVLDSSLHSGEITITGEETLRRLASEGKVALGAEDFYFFWTNQEVIPQEWKKALAVFFDGDILVSPSGIYYTLCLFWIGERWGWNLYCLGNDRDARSHSAILV